MQVKDYKGTGYQYGGRGLFFKRYVTVLFLALLKQQYSG